jgi:hypothetical protein
MSNNEQEPQVRIQISLKLKFVMENGSYAFGVAILSSGGGIRFWGITNMELEDLKQVNQEIDAS